MDCQYCGKKISLVRRLKDDRFCCVEHRRAHTEVMAESGLARLLETPVPAKFAVLDAEPQPDLECESAFGGFGTVVQLTPGQVLKGPDPEVDAAIPRLAQSLQYLPQHLTIPIPDPSGPVGISFPVTLELKPVDRCGNPDPEMNGMAPVAAVTPSDDAATWIHKVSAPLARAWRLYRVLPHRWISEQASICMSRPMQLEVSGATIERSAWPGREMMMIRYPAYYELGRIEYARAAANDWSPRTESLPRVLAITQHAGLPAPITPPIDAVWQRAHVPAPELFSLDLRALALASVVPLSATPSCGSVTPASACECEWKLASIVDSRWNPALDAPLPHIVAVDGTCSIQPQAANSMESEAPRDLSLFRFSMNPLFTTGAPPEVDVFRPPAEPEVVEEGEEELHILSTLELPGGGERLPVQTHFKIAPLPAEAAEDAVLVGAQRMQYRPIRPEHLIAARKPERVRAVAQAGDSKSAVAVLDASEVVDPGEYQTEGARTVPGGPSGKEPIVSKNRGSIMMSSLKNIGFLRPLLTAVAKFRGSPAQDDASRYEVADAGPTVRFLRDMHSVWKSFPNFCRGIALVAVPLLIPTLFYARINPSTPSGSTWQSMKQAIRNRATIFIEDDFRNGLGAWAAPGESLSSWTLDSMSFAQPGQLGLLQKSLPLTDYRFEFLARLESKSLGLVVRAADSRNYYVSKLVVAKPGPVPLINIVRYSVIDGVEGPRTELPLPMSLDITKMFTVLGTVRGENFTISINGQMVDNWTDSRFLKGGIGFFAEKGAQYRLRWVRVIDKDDFLGWLCSRISPQTADIRASGEHQ